MRGDHYVTLVVQVPDKLSDEQKELLRKFDAAGDNTLNGSLGGATTEKKKKGFMDKLKESFED